MRTQIEVTARDIQKGEPKTHWACPIARAIKRVVKRVIDVEVEADGVILYSVFDDSHDTLPIRVRNFIYKFDTGKQVKPLTFTLNIPVQYLKKGHIK